MTTSQNYQSEFRNAIKAAIQPWVEWKHISIGLTHCPTCLNLDRRWFVKTNMPALPQHPRCHCTAEPILASRVRRETEATSDYSKYDPYLFDPKGFYKHNKDKLVASWGYTIHDSLWLKSEIEKQGLQKYIDGDYSLGILNDKGQRISIRVEIPRKIGSGSISFLTGWMVYPSGHIQLTTPYGGK